MSYKINGNTFEALGVTKATLSLPHLDVGRLSLQLDRAVTLSSMGLSHGTAVVLSKDSTTIFRGKVNAPGVSGEVESLEVVDFWSELESLTFVNVAADMDELDYDSNTKRDHWFGASGEESDDAAMTAAERLEVIVDYADAAGIALQLGSSVEDMDFNFPPEPARNNPPTSDVIRQLMETLPHWCLWVDYATSPPTLNASQRLASDSPGITTLHVGEEPLADFNIRLRRDLTVDGVVIKWDHEGAISYEVYPPETKADEQRVLLFSRRYNYDRDAGYAQTWYEALNDIIVEGAITLQNEECDHSWHPGKTVNITGSRNEYSDMRGLVQDVSHDLLSGVTSLSLGWPQYLGQRYLRDIERSGNDDAEEPDPAPDPAPELPGPQGGLTGYCVRVGDDVVFRVAPGSVNGGDPEEGDIVPLWDSTSTPLDASSPPGVTVTPGTNFTYYLYVEFEPQAEKFSLLDAEDDIIEEWRAINTGSIDEARIRFAVGSPAARKPAVNPSTGAVTTGRVYFRLGTLLWPIGEPVPTIIHERTGSQKIILVPPDQVYI